MKKQEVGVTNDLMFKRIFGRIGNEEITKDLIESILGKKVKEMSLDVNKEFQGKTIENKQGIVDIKAKLKDDTILIIEMQRAKNKYMINRIMLQWAKAYSERILRGQEYTDNNLPKVIAMLFVEYDLEETKESIGYHTSYGTYADKENYEKKIKVFDRLEGHIIELNKFKKTGNTKKEEWMQFIKAKGAEDMAKIKTKNRMLEKAKEEYQYLISDPSRRAEFEAREMELLDTITICTQYKKEGIQEGERISQKAIVFNMYEQNISIEKISKLVGISRKEVEVLIDEARNERLLVKEA